MRKIILTFLFLLLLLVPVSAVAEIKEENIKSFNLSAPEGLSLSGMEIIDLPANSNNTFELDAYGELYTLYINSSKSWGWWNFDLTLIHPNGTIETSKLKTLAPAPISYDIHIQYYFLETDSVFDIDVYAALFPLSATFESNNPTTSGILQFSRISGSSNNFYDLVLYATTNEEFKEQSENALGLQLSHAAGEVFSWTWDKIISFIELIPGIGPYLASVLEIAALSIDAIIFYFSLLFLEYSETTFLTIEFFILSYSFTGFKRGGLWGFLKKLCASHMAMIEFSIKAAEFGISVFSRIVSAVAAVVQSLKPL